MSAAVLEKPTAEAAAGEVVIERLQLVEDGTRSEWVEVDRVPFNPRMRPETLLSRWLWRVDCDEPDSGRYKAHGPNGEATAWWPPKDAEPVAA